MTQNAIEIASAIRKDHPSSWKIDALRVGGREAFDSLYFLDKTFGWVAGGGRLYQTVDGGKTWKQVKIDLPQQAVVAGIFFINPSLGWVALQRHASDVRNYQENQFWIMQTRDGGQTWQEQREDKGAVITRISFVNEQKGWLTGIKYIGIQPLRSVFLILYTSDQGQHWTDVSGDLNHIAQNDQGFVNGWISDIILEGALATTVLTVKGQIFKTVNSGQSWQQVAAILNEPEQTCICRLGVQEGNKLWVAGGAYSDEGVWGMLSVKQAGKSWIKHRLGSAYFADAFFLSEQQVLACGSIPRGNDKGSFSGQRDGVILYSSDGGYEWSIIYRNDQVESINKLAVVDSEHVWAVGNDGLILRLDSLEKTSTAAIK